VLHNIVSNSPLHGYASLRGYTSLRGYASPEDEEILSSISLYLDDSIYKLALEKAVVKSTGMLSEWIAKSVNNWKDIYDEFESHDFNPTDVLSNTSSTESAEIALLFTSCDVNIALTSAIGNSNCDLVKILLIDGRAIPLEDHLLTCVHNTDTCSLKLLVEDSRVDRGILLSVLMLCIDINNIECAKVALRYGDVSQKIIVLCIREAINNDAFDILSMLVDSLLAPDYDLLDFAKSNGDSLTVRMLNDKYDHINNYLESLE
jgi:hypothetical protein